MRCNAVWESDRIIALQIPEDFHLATLSYTVTVTCSNPYSSASNTSLFRPRRNFTPVHLLSGLQTAAPQIFPCSSRDSSIQTHRVDSSSIVVLLLLALSLDSIISGTASRSMPKNAEPVSRRDESVPKHEQVIKDDPKEISKIIGKRKEGKGKGKRKR
jgi:hypothetical protein